VIFFFEPFWVLLAPKFPKSGKKAINILEKSRYQKIQLLNMISNPFKMLQKSFTKQDVSQK
jgi:hypothetical protein